LGSACFLPAAVWLELVWRPSLAQKDMREALSKGV
jgi:hypothetical protein